MDHSRGVVDVGTPPSGFQGWETVEVRFHKFTDLPNLRGTSVTSPEFTCLGGHRLRLAVYPRGSALSGPGMVAICLDNMSDERIEIISSFVIRDSTNKEVVHYTVLHRLRFAGVGRISPSVQKLCRL